MDRRTFLGSTLATALPLTSSARGPNRRESPPRRYTFVLVHGSWQGGWIWKDVKALLEANGHRVYTPTCTGCGERVHLSTPDVGLDTHIQDITNVIDFEELTDVVLVGHSYSGLTITGVADRRRDQVRHMVFFDALVPRPGVMSGVRRDPVTGELPPEWLEYSKKFKDGYLMNFWESYPPKMLVPESETVIIERLKKLMTTHPARQWTDELVLENGGWKGIPRSYIHCIGQEFQKSSERMVAPAREPGWNFLKLDIPRCGMMTHPNLVAKTFEQLASPEVI